MSIRIDVTTVIRVTHERTGTVSAHECTVGEAYENVAGDWREKIKQGADTLLTAASNNVLSHIHLDFQPPSDPADS